MVCNINAHALIVKEKKRMVTIINTRTHFFLHMKSLNEKSMH